MIFVCRYDDKALNTSKKIYKNERKREQERGQDLCVTAKVKQKQTTTRNANNMTIGKEKKTQRSPTK